MSSTPGSPGTFTANLALTCTAVEHLLLIRRLASEGRHTHIGLRMTLMSCACLAVCVSQHVSIKRVSLVSGINQTGKVKVGNGLD